MKALVLSSGGVDSTTCVAMAVNEFGAENVKTVTAFYGQKHAREIDSAKRVAEHYGLENINLNLQPILSYSDCPLLMSSDREIKHQSYADQIAENGEGMVDTYVPFRNGLLLSAVAALGMSMSGDDKVSVFIGAHADDAAGNAYADCSLEFIDAMERAIEIGTYGRVKIVAPFVNDTKAEVVAAGLELGAPYELTWSCYEGGDEPCGTCATCLDRAKAFAANGVEDPAVRKNQPKKTKEKP